LAHADRGLNDHRTKVRDALTCLLTETVTDDKHKEILRRVLGSDTTFDKPILSFDKPNMAQMVKFGVQNVVWENAACKHSVARSVLKPINSADQEPLLEFLGIPLYIILFFFTRFDFFSIVVREHVHAQLQEIVPHSECSR
jgi:hypothetical protein